MKLVIRADTLADLSYVHTDSLDEHEPVIEGLAPEIQGCMPACASEEVKLQQSWNCD